MIKSSSKGRPTLGEVRMKETKRDIVDGKQGTLDRFEGRAPSKKGV